MRVIFANGSPAQQEIVRTSIPDALTLSLPLIVTVSFGPQPGDHEYFAYTTVNGDGTAGVIFDDSFPNFEAPFDGEAFARETVAHEFSHMAQAYLGGREGAILALFEPAGGSWAGGEWEDHVQEADAETMKDALTEILPSPSTFRKFTNRTNFHLPAENFAAWLALHNDGIEDTAHASVSLGGSIDVTGTLDEVRGAAPDEYGYHERSWQWNGAFGGWWGRALFYSGTMHFRWRWTEPLDEIEGFPGSGIYETYPVSIRETTKFGSDAPFVDVWQEPFSQPLPDASDWVEVTVGLGVYSPAVGGLEAVFDDPATFAKLPWLTTWDFAYFAITDADEPSPELEIELLDATYTYIPGGLFGEWAFPNNPGPPPPKPRSTLRIGIPQSRGLRRSGRRIVSRRGDIWIDDLNDGPVVEDEILD